MSRRGQSKAMKKDKIILPPYVKKEQDKLYLVIATEIKSQKAKGGLSRKEQYGVFMKVFKQYQSIYPWPNYDKLKYLSYKKSTPSNISSTETEINIVESTIIPTNNFENNESTIISTNNFENNDEDESIELNFEPSTQLSVGRPVGSNKGGKEVKKNYISCLNWICIRYSEKKKISKGTLPLGALKSLISEGKELHNVSSNISDQTIFSRYRCGRMEVDHPGTKSPMDGVEEYISDICVQKDMMNQGITVGEGLALANSLVEGTDVQNKVIEFQMKWARFDMMKYPNGPGLTKGYWRGYMRRSSDKISAQKTKNFASNRAEWCTYHNTQKMYDLVYTAMVEVGVAVKLASPEFHDNGFPVTHKLIHPNFVIHADEVGNNTNQRDDDNVGGERRLTGNKTSGGNGMFNY